ncbi:YceI family protein [Litorimonas sp. RW-G-Af-16]
MKSFIIVGTALGLLACGAQTSANESATDMAAMPASAAAATATTPASAKRSAERNGNWLVNPRESHIRFSAEQEGKTFEGEFKQFFAVINFYPNDLPNSSVEVTVPIASIEAGSTDRNSTVPGKVWFSTKKFPQAMFKSNDITQTAEGAYLAKGTLSMKGIEKPFDLPFALDMSNGALMTSQVTLDRTNWTVGEAPWDTDEWVSRAVKLDIQVTASNPN